MVSKIFYFCFTAVDISKNIVKFGEFINRRYLVYDLLRDKKQNFLFCFIHAILFFNSLLNFNIFAPLNYCVKNFVFSEAGLS